ncbi:tetratricopeptide repeat protein [Candidatus Obscuribacterales bacterium]|nr:tetratricopeptide repeat protein [Candidatus Obscuribacterales bacterium]MBX3152638.1 tetratricopeptide repeat protein [Candidatus Obscuribacterales bacterium]
MKIASIFAIALLLSASMPCGAMQLPIENSEIEKELGQKIDPNSKYGKELHQQYTVIELYGRAQEFERKGDLKQALDYFNAALKIDRNYFRDTPNRGYVFAKLGRWAEARSDFEYAIKDRWGYPVAEKVVEFCIEQKHPDMAKPYEPILESAWDKSSSRMILSKLCEATGRNEDAARFANDAFYLDCVFQSDSSKSKELAERLSGKPVAYPTPRKSAEREFWTVIRGIENGGKAIPPSQLSKLVPEPRYVTSASGSGRDYVVSGFGSSDSTGVIARASLSATSGVAPAYNGVLIEPNVFTCCLKKEDVTTHLSDLKIPFEKGYASKQNDVENAQPELTITAHLPAGNTLYSFSNKGFGQLRQVAITFNQTVPIEIKPALQPKRKTWAESLNAARSYLKQRKFKACRNSLCQAFVGWDDQGNDHKKQSHERREQYETFKREFSLLYERWKKPEIKKFFDEVSYWYLREEAFMVGIEPYQRVDFPTVSEFRNNKWTVTKKAFSDYMEIKVADRWRPRATMKGGALYSKLNDQFRSKQSKENVDDSANANVLNEDVVIEIEPLNGKYFDDEDFES